MRKAAPSAIPPSTLPAASCGRLHGFHIFGALAQFERSIIRERTNAGLKAALGLVPARPDTRWWHDYVAGHAHVFMLQGRLKFGEGDQSAPFPSAVVMWGADTEQVARLAGGLAGAWHIPAAEAGALRT